MKLTKLEEQGLRLTMCLARKGGQMTLPELSEMEGLSEALVAKVLGKLRSGGVLSALRGRNGGYALRAPSQEIPVSKVLAALGRPILEGCFSGKQGSAKVFCRHAGDCSLRPVWEYLEERIYQVLDDMTLADLIESEEHVRGRIDAMRRADGDKGDPVGKVPRRAACSTDR